MKKLNLLFSGVFLVISFTSFGNTTTPVAVKRSVSSAIERFTPQAAYSYTDFNFKSNAGDNYNRFNGHTNAYVVGGSNLAIANKLYAGIYLLQASTRLHSAVLLKPAFPTRKVNEINNRTLSASLSRILNQNFQLKLAASYGQNRINSDLYIVSDLDGNHGISHNHSENWVFSAAIFYDKPWKKFQIHGEAQMFNNHTHSDHYNMFFPAPFPAQMIAPLTNKAALLAENLEIRYSVRPGFIPFVNAGLVQVAQFSNSRPLVFEPIDGAIPQFNMDQNGYKLGAGFSFKYKPFTFKLEQKYYRSGRVYRSNQTLLIIRFLT